MAVKAKLSIRQPRVTAPRQVPFDAYYGRVMREMPQVGLAVDPEPIAERLAGEFQRAFHEAPLSTQMFAEMITAGVLMVLEEVAKQGQDAGNGAVMIAAPQPQLTPPEEGDEDILS